MAKLNSTWNRWMNHSLKKLCRVWLLFMVLLVTGGPNLAAQSLPTSEYALKAIFLYNFAHFVDWPPRAFPDSQTTLVIGVLGDDPFGIYLDETVRDEKVNGRNLVVQRYRTVEEISACHVLYISKSEAGHAKEIVAALKGRSILTVSEADGFSKAGVMIRFTTENKKVHLKIDVDAAKEVDLIISSKLLRLADIVTSRKE